jgi:hypothetical protein
MAPMGRPLSADEKRVILRILNDDFDGANALRRQVEDAFATRHWIEGLPSIDIMVGESSPAASSPVSSPITRTVIDGSGNPVGFMILWVEEGRISALEYAWVTDDPPTHLPPSEWIADAG